MRRVFSSPRNELVHLVDGLLILKGERVASGPECRAVANSGFWSYKMA